MEIKKVVITGANGFVGSTLVKRFLAEGIAVAAIDLQNSNIPNSGNIKYIPADFSNMQRIQEELYSEEFDVFFHFAWRGTSGEERGNPEIQLDNALLTINCLKLSKMIGCNRFVSAGSIMEDEAYEATNTDSNRPGLGYIYGSGKLAAHMIGKSIATSLGIDMIWAKITNAYGPGEYSQRFINTTLRKIIRGEKLEFTSGEQNYDFVYIDDVVDAFYRIGKNGKPFCDYLIGSGSAKPLREYILEIKEAVAVDNEFIFGNVPFTGINLPLSCFDCEKLIADTGYLPKVSFDDGVKKTLKWIKVNDGGVKNE